MTNTSTRSTTLPQILNLRITVDDAKQIARVHKENELATTASLVRAALRIGLDAIEKNPRAAIARAFRKKVVRKARKKAVSR